MNAFQTRDPRETGSSRKIGLAHLAFFRAYVQGLDTRQMWERYLGGTGPGDLRSVRGTLQWLRLEFVAAARRQGQARYAAVLKRDANLLPEDKAPSLDAFAQRFPEGFYSERELIALYAEEVGQGGNNAQRRARLRERQLEALAWAEKHLVSSPVASDRLEGWLDAPVAGRLARVGIGTVGELVDFINTHGYRWWVRVPRLGEKGAARLTRFLDENAESVGVSLLPYAMTPKRSAAMAPIIAAAPRATGILPLERFVTPASLDGSTGRYRADPALCMLEARNDYEAIQAWLQTKREASRRSCRKEAERFLLWAIVQKGKPVSSLTAEDCTEYRDFLADPQPAARWCAPRGTDRWAPGWRPFTGPLSAASQHQATVILKGLAEWLMRQRYLIGNPWDGLPAREHVEKKVQADRSLTRRQWAALMDYRRGLPATEAVRRENFVLSFAHATGLRRFELAQATTGDLVRVPVDGEDEEAWILKVTGKRSIVREVPFPARAMEALCDYLSYRGLPANPSDCPPETRLIGRLSAGADGEPKGRAGVSADGVYKMLKKVFADAAKAMVDKADAQRFKQASTHWIRHTHGTHAVAAGIPVDVVQGNMGHASLDTTTIYVTAERSRRIKEMRRLSAVRAI